MGKTGGTKSILIGECTIMVIVPRHFRRPPMRAPIVSFKHQRNENLTYVGGNANNQFLIYVGGEPGSQPTPGDVPAGNKVYGINVSVNFIHPEGSGTDTPSWMLVHLRAGQSIADCFSATGASEWSVIGLSSCRNQVLKSFMTIVGSEDAGPKTWNLRIKIPKMWHRVREGDALTLIFNAGATGPLSIGTRFKSFS